MDVQRINDFLDAYSRAIELPQNFTDILKVLMPSLVRKYERYAPKISVLEDDYDKYIIKPINEEYSLEDLLLNRLMRNVLNINIVDSKNDSIKGGFFDETHNISFNYLAIKKQLDNRLPEGIENEEELRIIAAQKLVMHEFEHALQTQFKKGGFIYPIGKSNYRKIIDEISKIGNGKYRSQIQTFEESFHNQKSAWDNLAEQIDV